MFNVRPSPTPPKSAMEILSLRYFMGTIPEQVVSSAAAGGEGKRVAEKMKKKRKNGSILRKWEREEGEKAGERLFEGIKKGFELEEEDGKKGE